MEKIRLLTASVNGQRKRHRAKAPAFMRGTALGVRAPSPVTEPCHFAGEGARAPSFESITVCMTNTNPRRFVEVIEVAEFARWPMVPRPPTACGVSVVDHLGKLESLDHLDHLDKTNTVGKTHACPSLRPCVTLSFVDHLGQLDSLDNLEQTGGLPCLPSLARAVFSNWIRGC